MEKMKGPAGGLEVKTRRKLEALPPKVRLAVAVTVLAAFAGGCLYVTVTAVAGFGRGRGSVMEIRHIGKPSVPAENRMNLYDEFYGKGTETE